MRQRDRPRVALLTRVARDDYRASLEQAGADVLALDPDSSATDVATLVREVSGVCLPGGFDVDPRHYDAVAHPTIELAGDARDALDLSLARLVVAQDVPLLAICRGLQVLNVALGGTLVQDIPSQWPGASRHAAADTPTTVAHGVTVTAGSRLARAVAAGMSDQVNSRHHQAVARLGAGLAVTATASDGIIEGIEHTECRYCVGVQWHPENFWRGDQMRPLFAQFVDAMLDRLPNPCLS